MNHLELPQYHRTVTWRERHSTFGESDLEEGQSVMVTVTSDTCTLLKVNHLVCMAQYCYKNEYVILSTTCLLSSDYHPKYSYGATSSMKSPGEPLLPPTLSNGRSRSRT